MLTGEIHRPHILGPEARRARLGREIKRTIEALGGRPHLRGVRTSGRFEFDERSRWDNTDKTHGVASEFDATSGAL